MNNDLKIVLITGTGRGLGKYLTEYYVQSGCHVIGCSRNEMVFEHDRYTHMQGDVSDMDFIRQVFKYIKAEFGKLDVLINNAVYNPAIISSVLLPHDATEKALMVNVFAPMMFCQEAIKLMRRNKFGRIINIGSMVTRHEDLGGAIYSTCKSAINTYSRVIARDAYKAGITVNVVAISAIDTSLSQNLDPALLNNILFRNAVPEMGKMEEVTQMIDYLIQPGSSTVTAQIIYLGGV